MASRELRVEIIGDASSLNKALGSVGKSSSKLGGAFKTMGKAAALGLGALAVGAVAAGKEMVSMASDAAEVDSKMKVVFGKTLPGLTKDLDAFAEATGASRFELREQAADVGALVEPLTASKKAAADMSANVVKLATDLGSFNNVPVGDALLAIRSGLVGEAEPLRRFGVLLNEAAVNAEGVRMGLIKTGGVMTEQQKVQARYNLIMDQTKLAQGDATRTAGSMANQFKALQNNLRDAGTEMGMKLLPAVLAVVQAFNTNWPQIEQVVDAVMAALISGAERVVAALKVLVEVGRTVFNFIRENQTAFEMFAGAAVAVYALGGALQAAAAAQALFNVAAAANPYVLIAAAVLAAAAALAVLYVKNEQVRQAVNQFAADIKATFLPVIQALEQAWTEWGNELISIARTTFRVIVTLVSTFIQNTLAPFKIFLAVLRGDWSAAWNEMKGIVVRNWNAIVTLLQGAIGVARTLAMAIGKALLDGIGAGMRGIAAKVAAGMQLMWNALKSAASTAYSAAYQIGSRIVSGIWDGFSSMIGGIKSKIESAIGSIIKGIDVPGFSPPRAAGEHGIGKPIMLGFADGIMKNTGYVSERASEAVRTVVKKASQAARDARAEYVKAFGDLAQAGIDAIAAKYAKWQPPSLLKAQREVEEREAARIKEAVAQTTSDLMAAQEAAMAAARESSELQVTRPPDMSDEEWAKAKADALAAQESAAQALISAAKAHDDALFNQRQAQLAKDAAAEQIAHDKKVAKEQENFAARLKRILAEGGNIHAKVMKLFADFDLGYLEAGKRWGKQLAAGLRAALADVEKAADELAQAAKDRTKPGSPAKKGPLSTFDMYDAGREFGMDWAAGMASASRPAGRAAGSVAGRAAGALGGRGSAGGRGSSRTGGGGGGKEQTFSDSAGGGGPMPSWAYPPIWETAVSIATSIGKLKEFGEAIRMGAYKSNAGLLNGIFQNRSKRNWGLVSYPIVQQMMEMMKKPDGMSGKEVADYFGLLAKGGIVKKDGYAYLHANEAVVPLPKGGRMGGGGATVIFNGPVLGTEAELTRKIIEGIRREQSRGAPTITRGR